MKRRIIFMLAIILFSLIIHSQGRVFDNLGNMRMRSSEHFNFLYKEEHEGLIRELAGIAERQYEILSGSMNTAPHEKINILLTDQSDIPNGFASMYIDDYINLYVTNPDAQFIVKHRDWIEFVLLHEMTHIFNLTSLNPSCLHLLNNRLLYLPNAAMPMYVMEGYTVYNESTLLSGRLYDTNFESFMRTMILDDDIQPLDRAATYVNRHWPYANLPYLYGGYIFDAYKRNGADLTGFNSLTCLSCLPVGNMLPDVSIAYHTGTLPSNALSKAFEYAENRTDSIVRFNTPSQRRNITFTGGSNSLPLYSDNMLYYVKYYGNKHQRFVKDDGENISELFRTSNPLSVFADLQRNSFFYEHLDYYDNINTFFTIHEYINSSCHELPSTERGMYPVSLNDTLYFVRNNWDCQYIIVYDVVSETCADSFAFNDKWRYYDLDINDSGDIILSVWRPGGFSDIAEFNVHDRDISFITQDRYADFMPQWSDSGFYYISDFEGLNKVYEFSFTDSLSHAVYTTLYQVVSYDADEQNGIIYVQDLSSEGYDIYKSVMSYDEGIRRCMDVYQNYAPETKNVQLSDSKQYVLPVFSSPGIYFFLPWLYYQYFENMELMTADIGILSGIYLNSDVTSSHSVNAYMDNFIMRTHYDSLSGNADSMQYIYYGGIEYTISSSYPDIILNVSFANGNSTFSPDTTQFSAGISVDRVKSFDYFNISAFISSAYFDSIDEYGFSASAIYSNTESGIETVMPTGGFTASVNTYSKVRKGSANLLSGANTNLTLYFPLLGRGSIFLASSVFLANADSIALTPSTDKELYPRWKLFYSIGMSGIDSQMLFSDFVTVKPGFELPLVIINRGFPIPFLASLPVVFDYISWRTSLTYAYSRAVTFNQYVIESGIYIRIMASQLFPLKAGINAYYMPSEGKYGINLSIKI